MAKEFFDAPRPSSLRSLVAGYFVLSFRDYQDSLRYNAFKSNAGGEIDNKVELPFVRRMHQLLWWPPDIFALTSTVLARTGAYRMVVGPQGRIGKNLWQHLDWQARVNSHSEAWRSAVSKLLLIPADMKSVPLNEHNSNNQNYQKYFDADLWKEIDARVADRSSRRSLEKLRFDSEKYYKELNLDLLDILDPYPYFDNEDSPDRGKHSTYNLLKLFIGLITRLEDEDGPLADQNLLAVSVKADRFNRGIRGRSEEKAAKFFEAIIGLHILADGASESIGVPRGSTHESAVFDAFANIMLTLRGSLSTASKFYGVVLPKLHTPQSGLTLRNLSHNLTFHNSEVEVMWRSFPWSNFDENTLNILYVPHPFDFDPNRFKVETEHYESVGYFTYDPGDWKGVGNVVRLIDDIQKKGINTHMLVFTETAFNEDTYKRLLTALSQRYGSENPKQMPIVVAGVAKTENDLPYNELRLATYFAGKWYQLSQHKHHRWQLNASQIQQYNLQGHLSTARPLFERSIMDQRRITFYAPTPWLVLSPLICEDLSRIEPVSELIRGVGPTLVLALLLDGPQLENRWPGRYASVLADDPGTGVLTVTSYGFAKASRLVSKRFDPPENKNGKSDSDYQTVASWKDPTSKFQPLTTSENEAMLLTLTAQLERQFTLDRRETKGKATGFRLDGIQRFKLPETECDQGIDRRLDSFGNWSDIREVTAVTYIASAALSILRPHYSKHPIIKEANKKTDTWNKMANWCSRVRSVRNLIDIMLGQPLLFRSQIGNTEGWIDLINAEKRRLDEKRNSIPQKSSELEQSDDSGNEMNTETSGLPDEIRDENNYGYFKGLKATRNVLLNHILSPADPPDGLQNHQFAYNRHLFAVLAFSQTTIDVEVRDDEAKWPTDSLRFAATVLRILLDSIAGIEFLEGEKFCSDTDASTPSIKTEDNTSQWDVASRVYLERLKIAGRENRDKETLWENYNNGDQIKQHQNRRDVDEAPKPLLYHNQQNHLIFNETKSKAYQTVNYYGQFQSVPGKVDFPTASAHSGQNDSEKSNNYDYSDDDDYPNRYDFYRMVLALIEAILEETNPSLWKRCQSEFIGHIGDVEMRRLTLLVLMLLPSLIHEQLEYDYMRLKRTDEIAIRSKVIHKLIKKAETILKSASIKTGTSWDPKK